jgi:aspartate dehydrogenase
MRLAIIGNGFLAGIVVEAYEKGMLPDYELVGILGRSEEKTKKLAAHTKAVFQIEDLLAEKPDIVVEAASVAAVKDYAGAVLKTGASLVVLSIGAFADEKFYQQTAQTAKEHGAKVHLASGAIGGFDVLRTLSLMDQAKVTFETHKGPASLQNTPLFTERLMSDAQETKVFSGSAAEAIGLLPTKVNVAVAASLATVGPEAEHVEITSVPGFVGDDHRITAEIPGVKAVVDIYSSTSAIAGWSVVALLRNLTSPIVF